MWCKISFIGTYFNNRTKGKFISNEKLKQHRFPEAGNSVFKTISETKRITTQLTKRIRATRPVFYSCLQLKTNDIRLQIDME